MATAFQHRIVLIVPAAKVAAVVSWFQANIGPASVPADLGPALNASGSAADPVTHRWSSGAWSDDDGRRILFRLCQLAGVATPTLAQWQGWTRAEKRAWLLSVRDAILAGYGVYVQLSPGDGNWDRAGDALAVLGLRVIAA
jgi:hypothetical protein